jgi:hypothetical protein
MRKTIRKSREEGGRRKGERWGLAATFLAAARTSGDRSGGGEGGDAQRWVAAGGDRLRPCRPERSDAGALPGNHSGIAKAIIWNHPNGVKVMLDTPCDLVK